MKNVFKIFTLLFISHHAIAQTGKVGIGTTTPLARLHVKDSSVLFSGGSFVLAITGMPPMEGPGIRMMWYSDKAAFRAGAVSTTQWDKANIGDYSTAFGHNTRASGPYSIALGESTLAAGVASISAGQSTTASGSHSFAMGFQTTASSTYSIALGRGAVASQEGAIAMGYETKAKGNNSLATGYQTSASDYAFASGILSNAYGHSSSALGNRSNAYGAASTASGYNTNAYSFFETAIGGYNTVYTPAAANAWNANDRLFVIGNGISSDQRSDALVVLKNGNTGIGNNTPGFPLNFANSIGDKISFFGNSGGHYGIGIGDYLLQIHSDAPSSDIAFGSGSSSSFNENMRIKGNGNVGIGNSDPNAPLAFANTTGKKISLYSGDPNSQYGFAIQSGELQIYSDAIAAKISFGYYSGGVFTQRMNLNNSTGILNVSGINYASDERYKKQITTIENSLEKIESINGVEYYMRTEEFPSKHFDEKLQVGLLAQELEKILPQAVQTDVDGYKAIDYARVVPLLVEGIKEQQKQIDDKQKQIDSLASHEKEYRQQLDELKTLVKNLTKNN